MITAQGSKQFSVNTYIIFTIYNKTSWINNINVIKLIKLSVCVHTQGGNINVEYKNWKNKKTQG